MAENVVLGSFATLQNSSIVATLNANNALIENAFLDCVSIVGTLPNAMNSNLDMNSFQILNLPTPSTLNSPIRLVDFENAVFGAAGSGIYGLLNGNNLWHGTNTFQAATFNAITTVMETITSGVLADNSSALVVNATLTSTPTTLEAGIQYNITSGNTTTSATQTSLRVLLLAGYTGNAITTAGNHNNQCAGVGTGLIAAAGTNLPVANFGDVAQATGSTVGTNIGVVGASTGGVINVGLLGTSQTVINSGTNIGVTGTAINTGTSPVFVGGWFSLNQTTVPTVSAALIADNGSQALPIFLARANNVTKVTITSAGNLQAAAGIDSSAIGANTPSTGSFTTLATSGIFTSSNGAVATPSIVAANSSTTGISFPAAGQWALSSAGSKILDYGVTTASTVTTQGSFSISGSGQLQMGGVATLNRNGGTGQLTMASNGSTIVLQPANTTALTLAATTASTSSTTGSAVVAGGGLGVAGTIWGGGSLGLAAPSTQAGTSFSTDLVHFCYITSSASAVTVTLPAASSNTGYTYLFKQIGAGAVSSATSNVSPIGSATPGTAITASAGKWALMQSDGTNWIIIAAN